MRGKKRAFKLLLLNSKMTRPGLYSMNIPQIISKSEANVGDMGQFYLAGGKDVALRRWELSPCDFTPSSRRDYEIVGCLISGTMELDVDGQPAKINPGDSWLIPKGSPHRYRVIEDVVAIEATSPPARFNDRDEPKGKKP